MATIKSFGAALMAAVTVLGALDAKNVTSVFPAGWGGVISAILALCATIAHFYSGVAQAATPKEVTAARGLFALLLIASIATISLGMTSCMSTTTTAPDGTVTKSSSFLTEDQIKAITEGAIAAAAERAPRAVEPVK